ncbi:MAG: ComEC/Rec2 family competence protein [Tannerella sp.]|jgi:competence protein ComEC|nr:ComEC/Rec2 family competence protein [Tannerella sp.]
MIRRNESIIEEIQKRPFVRPLIFWLLGILLYVYFPLQPVSFALPVAAFGFIAVSFFFTGKSYPNFDDRWVWGILFACLTVFLAIQTSALREASFQFPSKPGLLLQKAREMQQMMVGKLDALRLSERDKAVLAMLTVNYTTVVSFEIRNMFSVTGVVHILSVSGYHVGIVGAFVGLTLSVIPNRTRAIRILKYLIIILFVWVFTFVAGLGTATVRAAVMITIFLIANILNRYSDRYNILAGAAFCMLVYNPFYLFDIGFQLSYVAVFFLLYLQPKFSKLLEIRNPLLKIPWEVLTVTLAAQIGTLFLCYYYFGSGSLVFLFTNLSMSLLSSLIIPATLIFMVLPAGLPGSVILQLIIEYTTRWMMWVVERFSEMPYAYYSMRFDFGTMVLSYIAMFLFLIYLKNRTFKLLLFTFLILLLILLKNILP